MKPIKIIESNAAQIMSVLESVNGKSTAHTYTSFHDINWIVQLADKKLMSLLPKKYHVGAVFSSVSGEAVPNAYKYKRIATSILIERRSTGWFLIDVRSTKIYKDGGRDNIMLTKNQDAEAVSIFRKQYLTSVK
jgi:hypothetical protein